MKMPSEFELIRRFFTPPESEHDDVVLGVGDDCALLTQEAGMETAVTTDTLIAGIHFPLDTKPYDIGFKSAAVSLSDLAAMGARPTGLLLALTLPVADEAWLGEFSRGFGDILEREGGVLIGGDTTRGPLSVTVTALGSLPAGSALTRKGAREGDEIWVTGTLGDAALALRLLQDGEACPDTLRSRLDRPDPRIREAYGLRGIATAAIDISDGLAADLGHVLDVSGVGATLRLADIPLSKDFESIFGNVPDWLLSLTGGDDYELLFTAPPGARSRILSRMAELDCPVTCIGAIEEKNGLRIVGPDGEPFVFEHGGYDHFGA